MTGKLTRLVVNDIKIEPAVKLETKHIAIGVASMTILMEIVFLVIGKFDYTVLLGGLLGAAIAILNFFWMALDVQKAVLRDTPDEAKLVMHNSKQKRLLLMAVIAFVGIKPLGLHWAALLIPLFFPRITIFVKTLPIFQRKEEE